MILTWPELYKLAQSGAYQKAVFRGMLHASDGYLALTLPAGLLEGLRKVIPEPGVEPPSQWGRYKVLVMTPEELRSVGGADQIEERGRQFDFTLGPVEVVENLLPGWAKAWVLRVYSEDLKRLRNSYGLPSLPEGGFRAVVGVLRKGVTSARSPKTKLEAEP